MTKLNGFVVCVVSVLCAVVLAGASAIPQADQESGPQDPEVKSIVAQELLRSVGTQEFTYQKLNEVVNELLQTRDPRLIALFEENFEEAENFYESLPSAATLVYLGAQNPKYWEFIHEEAKKAIESGMPNPSDPGLSVGTRQPEELPRFKQWREEKELSLTEALELQQRYYSALRMLGGTLDPRAVDLLLEGLGVKNDLLLLGAVKSLARLQDKRSIEPLINMLERQPANLVEGLAIWLLYFDDPKALRAAERFIDDEETLQNMRSYIAKHGVKSIYGY